VNTGADFAPPGWVHEFFGDDVGLYRAFADRLAGRRLLEVGPGPLPAIAYFPQASLRVAIDPLISKYSAEISAAFGDDPVFAGIRCHAAKAEELFAEYEGKIDGAIVCRNALDHLDHPEFVLSNFATYAAPGCALLLWTDLFHLNGHDEGHHNITRDVSSFSRLISNLGFRIERRCPPNEGRPTIAFGCFAIRL
jgi:hypothetical protein